MSQIGVALNNVHAETVTVSDVTVGLTAAEVQELTKAAATGAVAPLADRIVGLSQRLGVTQGAALALLRTLGHGDVPVERLPDMLVAATTQILAMRQGLSRPSSDGGGVTDLKRQAVAALDTGAFDDATRLLSAIRAREQEASERRRRAVEESRGAWRTGVQAAAGTFGVLARAALALRDLARTRVHFEECLRVLAPADPGLRWSYAFSIGKVLSSYGDLAGHNDALEVAIYFYRLALTDAPRERVPLNWAMTQKHLGDALAMRGARAADTQRLREAVDAYLEALNEVTRERAPLDWARAQAGLGNALSQLGEREAGTALLLKAVDAYHEAFKECTRERAPLDWAATQLNLGATFQKLGEREARTVWLLKAINVFREALKEYTRERAPLRWATVQNNLGNSLATLGTQEAETKRVLEAVDAYREALKERTRERVPLRWAGTQANLGGALETLGERESGTAWLVEALAAYNAALAVLLPAQADYRHICRVSRDRVVALLAAPLRDRFAALRGAHPLPPGTGKVADKAFFDDLSGGL